MADTIYPGNATPSQVLSGQTFSAGSNYNTQGTMPNNGALGTITPTTSSHAIPAGYTSGGTVAGDANLVAANILSGISIFGVSGNVSARKYATGTATSGTTMANSNNATGGAISAYPLTVTGLAFQPVLIVWRKTTGNAPRFQYNANDTGLGSYPVLNMPTSNSGYQNQLPSGYGVTSNGFTMLADSSNTQYVWEAYA